MFEYQLKCFKKKAYVVPLLILCFFSLQVKVAQAEQFFPVALLADGLDNEIADLSFFESGSQMPGIYEVGIWLGEEKISTQKITFKLDDIATSKSIRNSQDDEESILDKLLAEESDINSADEILEIDGKNNIILDQNNILAESNVSEALLNEDLKKENINEFKVEENVGHIDLASSDRISGPIEPVQLEHGLNDKDSAFSILNHNIDENVDQLLPTNENGVENSTNVIKSYDDTGLYPCFTKAQLLEFGVNPLTIEGFDNLGDDECLDLRELIPNAFARFDFQKMNLNLSIPQVNMNKRYKGWVSPERWDDGINAGLLNYNLNFSDSTSSDFRSQSGFLGLNAGINIGAWRIRDNSSFLFNTSENGEMVSKWQHLQTYAERSFPQIKSSFVLGEYTSNSLIFDSIPFKGMELSSNENMYPSAMRGYAPIVRGHAESNATVTVRQNGHIIHQISVAPGEFQIEDLFSVSSNGDLEVTVDEFEGKKRTFTVPYASNPTFLREGRLKYNVTAGRFNGGDYYHEPLFLQAGFVRGLPLLTVFGGFQASENYLSFRLGGGFNFGHWGAMSADITQAKSTLADGNTYNGYSLGVLYARSFLSGTNIQIAGYRYSSEGFYQLQDTARKDIITNTDIDSNDLNNSYYNLDMHRRQRFHANISQKLASFGSVYVSGVQESYWNSPAVKETFRVGYGGTYKQLRYNLNYDLSNDSITNKKDQSILLSMSLPLGGSKRSTNVSHSSRFDRYGAMHNLAISGQGLNNRIGWGASASSSELGKSSFSGNINHSGAYGNTNLGLSMSNDNSYQGSFSASGGLIAHRNGVTFGKSLGSANVLVAAPNVKNVPILEGQGAKTDWRGYGIKSFATEFNTSNVALDIEKVKSNIEVEKNIVEVIPTKGAIVLAKFEANVGFRALLTIAYKGKPLPFGTNVLYKGHSNIVGEDGEVYLSGLEKEGVITAKWGDSEDKQCSLDYDFSKENEEDTVFQRQYECL